MSVFSPSQISIAPNLEWMKGLFRLSGTRAENHDSERNWSEGVSFDCATMSNNSQYELFPTSMYLEKVFHQVAGAIWKVSATKSTVS